MGMYTEFYVCARVLNKPEIVASLQTMLSGAPSDSVSETHSLFSTPRWRWLFSCSSYYFVPRSTHLFDYDDIGKYWVLIVRSDLKNYDGEIEKFFDWIRPHLEADENVMIGYSRYEKSREPTIYYGLSSQENVK